MLLVKTYVDRSKIQGVGLFAGQSIKNGTVIWKFTPGFDRLLRIKDLKRLPLVVKKWILKYGYYDKKLNEYVVGMDNDRFFNHSKNPNTDNKTDITIRASPL